MRVAKLLTLTLAAAALSACSTMNLNVKDTPPDFPEPTAIDGYFNFDGLREYDGNIVNFSFLGTGARKGELIHLEVWPFAGVGVGLAGFRVQLLPIDLGLGTLFYTPSEPTGGDEAEPADDDG